MTQTRFLQIGLVFGLLLLGLTTKSADAETRLISLHQSDGAISQINIFKGSEINITNDFETTLYNVKIVMVSTGKKMMQVNEFQSRQNFGLEFVREGHYAICYSLHPESESSENACFQVNVEAPLKA
jgi:hypothetical protein